ncbi:MAG TPA: D-alanyl-D-alanine endopeptidase [Steroidobacteraceae bacterium]|nr:D-alanyl-D-alanine endopeptidase [Steroidobacteraceae bacterium]
MSVSRRLPRPAVRIAGGIALTLLCLHAGAKQIRGHALRGPMVRSSSALVVDTQHDTVLYAKRPEAVQPIASITKLMTALVVLEAGQPLDQVIRITPADRIHGKGWYSRLKVGTSLTRRDLMHLALMSSENRAARTLANNYPGGMPAAIRAMNAKAKALGMSHTHFADPTGLSSDNVSCPADLAKLVIAASRNPTIRTFSTARHFAVRVRRRSVEFRTTDRLVANPAWKIIVQKTGFINEAGQCLVMETVIEGRRVVIVLLDSFGKYTRLADAARIKRWMESGGIGARGARMSMR